MAKQLIEIPIKSYLKKFVLTHFEGEPIAISRDDLFGQVFFSFLKRSKSYVPKPTPKSNSIIVSINDTNAINGMDPRYHQLEADPRLVLRMEKFYDRLFDMQMFAYLNGNLAAGKELKTAILYWLDFHDISPDEMTYETAKKRYYRHRKRKNTLKAKRDAA